MADAPIQGHSYTIHQLFSGDRTFKVDNYQREYSWDRRDVATLVRDLHRSFRKSWKPTHGRRETAEYHPYFLGPFVYVESGETTVLVDGQQRITTLHLLLIHLYRLMKDREEGEEAGKLHNLISTSSYGETTFTVHAPERDELLRALVKCFPYELPADPSPSVRNLYERSRDLEEDFPEELAGEALLHFTDWLLTRVCMVGIKAHSNQHGWEIFVTMNDRGVRLAPIDLLKGHLIEKARQDTTDLNNQWREMLTQLSALGTRTPGEFLETLLLAKYATVDDENDRAAVTGASHEWVRANADRIGLHTSEDYRQFLGTTIVNLALRYRTLLAAARSQDPEFAAIRYNAENGLDKQYLLIMAAVEPSDTETEFRYKASLIASFLDLIYLRKLVNGTVSRPNELDDDIYELVRDIRGIGSAAKLSTLLSARIVELSDEFRGMSSFGLQPDNRRQIRYLLARLTAFVEAECETDRDELSEFVRYVAGETPFEIEHVWANKFERHQAEVKTEKTFHSVRNRLGGLLLLPKSDNASFNDKTYPDKLPFYFRQNTLARSMNKDSYRNYPGYRKFLKTYKLDKLMTHYDEFTKESIEQRQQLYTRLCDIIWDPERLGFSIPKNVSPQRRQARRTRANYDVSLSDLLIAEFLRPGEQIVGKHKGTNHEACVLSDGKIQMSTGELFPNPSRAAMYAVNRQSCNGWTFWRLARDPSQTLANMRAQALASGELDGSQQLAM
ncbi:Protein of unknown function [Saccharopolyspora shandongensis]|uniref:DUF262 domain-containing protein n=1 Tax=Saccharopolyspora shandongensis TaxID=418495 RepID=A0A1H3M2G0_9PSEU|nr:DUF262 domain-containing protein [Saccharopolyspora shandongensis]SDY70773.1 Protein of unknown function [Saccharopolyspora shandongensis]